MQFASNRRRTIPLGISDKYSLYLDIHVTQSMIVNNHRRRQVFTLNQFRVVSVSLRVCAPQFVVTKSLESFALRPKKRLAQYHAIGRMLTDLRSLSKQRALLAPKSHLAAAAAVVAVSLRAANRLESNLHPTWRLDTKYSFCRPAS